MIENPEKKPLLSQSWTVNSNLEYTFSEDSIRVPINNNYLILMTFQPVQNYFMPIG